MKIKLLAEWDDSPEGIVCAFEMPDDTHPRSLAIAIDAVVTGWLREFTEAVNAHTERRRREQAEAEVAEAISQ